MIKPSSRYVYGLTFLKNASKQPVVSKLSKVTEFSTIQQCMDYLQSLAPSVNIPYVNIIIDVGTALNAFKFLWNGLEKYQNFVIHLEEFHFHFMKENFQVTCLSKNRLTFEQKLFTYRNGFLLLHRSPFLKCCVRMVI